MSVNPLRKVKQYKLWHRASTFTKVGTTVHMREFYDTRAILECGHILHLRGIVKQTENRRCPTCGELERLPVRP